MVQSGMPLYESSSKLDRRRREKGGGVKTGTLVVMAWPGMSKSKQTRLAFSYADMV